MFPDEIIGIAHAENVKIHGSLPNFTYNIKRINQLLFPLKSSENCRFSVDFRGNRSELI